MVNGKSVKAENKQAKKYKPFCFIDVIITHLQFSWHAIESWNDAVRHLKR